jgi:hypothetical protein
MASVDDVWVDHSVELDPTTMTPIQPDPDVSVEDSTTLKKINGRWLVDGVRRFGVSQLITGQTLSYVAVAGGKPLPDSLRTEIEQAYLKYWQVSEAAYLALDPGQLSSVETGSALERDRSVMQDKIAKHQPIRYDVQHNYRIAMQMDDTAWLYDTAEDQSVPLDSTTRKPVQSPTVQVHHATYRLIKGQDGWKVDFVAIA